MPKQRTRWHPMIREILLIITRDERCPDLDAQLMIVARVMALAKRERDKVIAQLWALTRRLVAAGEGAVARVVESIVVMTGVPESSEHAARRILA